MRTDRGLVVFAAATGMASTARVTAAAAGVAATAGSGFHHHR